MKIVSSSRKTLQLVSKEYIDQCFRYDADIGVVTWKSRPLEHFPSHKQYQQFENIRVGKIAGRVTRRGYITISFTKDRVRYWVYAHHIALVLSNVDFPEDKVTDHINGIEYDNRLINLRVCSQLDNMKNKKKYKNNTSGVTGVYETDAGKWASIISSKEIGTLVLGTFATFEEAIDVRKQAEEKYFKDFVRSA